MMRVLSAILILVLVHYSSQQGDKINCPDDRSIIAPCTCTGYTSWTKIGPSLHCNGSEQIDFAKMSKVLSDIYTKQHGDKVFDTLTIANSAITEFKENDFADLKFGKINIYNCNRLEKVHPKAFDDPSFTFNIYWANNPEVDAKQVFDFLDTFTGVDDFAISNVNGIPAKAFKNVHDNVYGLTFYGPEIKSIGANAFAHFTGKRHEVLYDGRLFLNFEQTSIEKLPDHAFAIDTVTKILDITFKGNARLSGDSFSPNSLSVGHNTVTTLTFDPIVSYLSQTAFNTFFAANPKNSIAITSGALDCTDERNQWLKPFVSRIKGYNC